jgi:hypothetical protein
MTDDVMCISMTISEVAANLCRILKKALSYSSMCVEALHLLLGESKHHV